MTVPIKPAFSSQALAPSLPILIFCQGQGKHSDHYLPHHLMQLAWLLLCHLYGTFLLFSCPTPSLAFLLADPFCSLSPTFSAFLFPTPTVKFFFPIHPGILTSFPLLPHVAILSPATPHSLHLMSELKLADTFFLLVGSSRGRSEHKQQLTVKQQPVGSRLGQGTAIKTIFVLATWEGMERQEGEGGRL